jgi:hypothetical protein
MDTFTIVSKVKSHVTSDIVNLVRSSVNSIPAFFLLLVACYITYVLVYGLFLCPTRHIPGPILTRFTALYFQYLFFGGSMSTIILEQHKIYGTHQFCCRLTIGPVLRLSPDRIDVQLPGIDQEAWGGHNETKFPWDKEATFCKGVKCGLEVENVVSIPRAREALKMRRLMGPPFARKFLLDQENIFKRCVEKVIQRIDQMCESNGGVDVQLEFKKYALDVVSNNLCLMSWRIAEFAYGGYSKFDSTVTGGSAEELMTQVVHANVTNLCKFDLREALFRLISPYI